MDTRGAAMITVAERPGVELSTPARLGDRSATRWRAFVRLSVWVLAVAVVATFLFQVHASYAIPPNVEADNAYIFLAAERMHDGLGPTSLPPKAPYQPWERRSDWAFLTQWPVGYPALICATRWLLGTTTVHAAIVLNIACVAVGLVAWFAWIRMCLPRRQPAWLIALVAAGSTFSAQNLIHPSSDAVLLGLLPVVLLLTAQVLRWSGGARRTIGIALAATAAGLLFWIRYAAIFVPVGIGGYFVVAWVIQKRIRCRDVAVYAAGSLAPIITLVAINHAFGSDQSVQEQLNLGHRVTFGFDPSILVSTWRHFAEQTLYAHRPEAGVFFLVMLPVAALVITLAFGSVRQEWRKVIASPTAGLSLAATVALFIVLIGATTIFGDKYDYVRLDRYYQPVRPFYFLFCLGPLVACRRRSIRLLACIPLVLALSWFVNQDAHRTLTRWSADSRSVTASGRWSRRFEPDSSDLYTWLKQQPADNLVVFSNFHDDIGVETGLPASPTPTTPEQLNDWLGRVRTARGMHDLRVYFVLDPDNAHRSDYLLPPEEIIERFDLVHCPEAPASIQNYVYVPRVDEPSAT